MQRIQHKGFSVVFNRCLLGLWKSYLNDNSAFGVLRSGMLLGSMKVNELTDYYHLPCKFRLRSGKEVYGVIWPGASGEGAPLNFASSADYGKWKRKLREQSWPRLLRQEIVAAKIL